MIAVSKFTCPGRLALFAMRVRLTCKTRSLPNKYYHHNSLEQGGGFLAFSGMSGVSLLGRKLELRRQITVLGPVNARHDPLGAILRCRPQWSAERLALFVAQRNW